MKDLEIRNQKIIDAVIEKEKTLCPGSVALIGIYGSFQSGDVHPLSDLDLLILINDDRGWQLGKAFIQDDLGVGHDIYCTNWEGLRQDARYEHPHIGKLMDSRIVYCADEKYRAELEKLRDEVRKTLAEPFGETDCEKAEKELKEAQCCYAEAMTEEGLAEVRRRAGGAIYYAENAVALLNKTYFRLGVKRRYEELNAMKKRPENLCGMIEDILEAETADSVKERLTRLMKELTSCFRTARQSLQPEKKPACAETLSGTYEEMFSNWHGKMVQAAENGDRHLAFMSLESLNEMLADIGNAVEIGTYDVLRAYDPNDLKKTTEGFDNVLEQYLREYEKAGMKAERYADIDAFAASYLNKEKAKTEKAVCRIRTAVPEDADRIDALFREMLQTIYHTDDVKGYEACYLDSFWNGGENRIYVAEDDEVRAFLSVQAYREEQAYLYLDDFSVAAAYRGSGIGTKLMETAEAYAREIGIPAIVLHVEKNNESAFRFYKRLGYTIFRDDGDRYLLSKELDQD